MTNGAIVLDYRPDEDNNDDWYLPGGVVLALATFSPDPYVTWTYGIRENGDVMCSNGHYFDVLSEAVRDLDRRAN